MKRLLFTLAVVAIFSLNMNSQSNVMNLWEGDAPFNKKDVKIEEVNENHRISKVSVPQLYHFPVESESKKPAVIIIPGGGYAREAFNHEGLMAAEWFNNLGVEAFVLKYRLPDTELVENASFVPLMDAQQAIYYVRENAAKWNVDSTNVGVIGFSAGGHLAASASTLFTQPVNKNLKPEMVRPDFSILLYPVISMDDACTHKGSKVRLLGEHPDVSLVELFSTEKQVTEQTPITLLVHAVNDYAVPVENSDRYASNLHKKGGAVTKVILPEGGHGFGFDPKRPVAYWTQYLEVWLNANITKK